MSNKDFFIEQWKKEMTGTINAIKALPADTEKLSFKPDPKSRTAMGIIKHILPHPLYLTESVDYGVMNEKDRSFNSLEEAASFYEESSVALINKLAAVDEQTWNTKVLDFAHDGHKVFERTMKDMFWGFLFDTIHHRGQLSTYYRQMGVRPPSIYGPTAEDMEARLAAASAQN